jgi:hypothetical protein
MRGVDTHKCIHVAVALVDFGAIVVAEQLIA